MCAEVQQSGKFYEGRLATSFQRQPDPYPAETSHDAMLRMPYRAASLDRSATSNNKSFELQDRIRFILHPISPPLRPRLAMAGKRKRDCSQAGFDTNANANDNDQLQQRRYKARALQPSSSQSPSLLPLDASSPKSSHASTVTYLIGRIMNDTRVEASIL